MRIIAFITATANVQAILEHIGKPTTPPKIAPARGPRLWEWNDAAGPEHDHPDGDPPAQPEPEYEFDQRVTW